MSASGDNHTVHRVSLKRARQACGPCRRKKARCPGEKPVCSLCQRLGQRCAYGGSQVATGSGRAQARAGDEGREGSQDSISSQRFQRIEKRLDKMTRILQENLPKAAGSYRDFDRDGSCDPEDQVLSMSSFPADFISAEVERYVTYFHDQPYCVFSRDWLLSRACSLPPEIALPLVALTSRLSHRPHEAFDIPIPTPKECARQAWDTLSNQHRDGKMSLSFLQGTFLMAQVDFADGRAHRAYASVALGLRTLQSAGLNKDLHTSSLTSPQTEERRRLTWSFFMLDRTYNASRKYSLCLADKHFTLLFPSPEPDSHSNGVSLHDKPEKQGEKVDDGILACLLRLFSLWGKATEYIFEPADKTDPPPWQAGSPFAALESQWMQFETQFPDAHRYLNIDTQLRARAGPQAHAYQSTWLCVQFLFHGIQCLLHHPFVIMIKLRHVRGNLSSTFLQKSFESSLLHSRWIVRLIREMMVGVENRPYDPFLGYLAAIAATIQLEHTVSNNPEVARVVNKEFRVLERFMTGVSVYWGNIGVLVQKVNELAARRRNYGSLYYNQDGYSGALPSMPTPSNIPKMSPEDEALMWDILDLGSSCSPAGTAELGDLVPDQHVRALTPVPEDAVRDRNGGPILQDLPAQIPLLDERVPVSMAGDPASWPFLCRNGGEGFDAIPDIPNWMILDEPMAEHL